MLKLQVYYRMDPIFRTDVYLTKANLNETHVFLKEIEANNLDDAWMMMQAENWSPNGEARSLIKSKGLHHTSMSIGDVFCYEGRVFEVDDLGFREVV